MSAAPPVQPTGRCAQHYFDPAVALCRDCEAALCDRCAIPVRRLGTFCRDCAMVRAGVRTRRRSSPAPSTA